MDGLGDLTPGWADLVEILVVAVLTYRVLLFLSGTRALQILVGVVVLILIYLGSRLFDLSLLATLLETSVQYGAIAALVVFQPELREALDRMGRGARVVQLLRPMTSPRTAEEVLKAATELARSRTGAIIAIQGRAGLDRYGDLGLKLDARVSADVIASVFASGSPLHDGAVIVSGDQIRFARAILPLSGRLVDGSPLGTRHRAALGLSEETDARVVVVSEETGRMSLAVGGALERDVAPERVREVLTVLEGERSDPGPTARPSS